MPEASSPASADARNRIPIMFRSVARGFAYVLICMAASLIGMIPAGAQTAPVPATTAHKMSAAEEAELFRSVDDILKFASTETALPEHEKVKRRLVSRDEVVAYLEKHMDEDEDSQRFRRSEVVLKKFGLIPRDFDLRPFLIALLREQIAGYYDPVTKTVNLLDWIDAEQQKPVLAHELTHALQDQSVDLQKWMKGTEKDLITVENPTSENFELDEAAEARQAVVEGQATVTLIDYQLIPAGMSMASSPQIVEAMRETMLVGTPDSVQFQKAPLFLKEALTFPYRYGLGFVGEVVAKRGKAGANALFQNPPVTTRQIMEPETFLSGEKLPAMPVPDFKRLFKDYDTVDVGGFGHRGVLAGMWGRRKFRCADDDVGQILMKAYQARVLSTSKIAARFILAQAQKAGARRAVVVGQNNVGRRVAEALGGGEPEPVGPGGHREHRDAGRRLDERAVAEVPGARLADQRGVPGDRADRADQGREVVAHGGVHDDHGWGRAARAAGVGKGADRGGWPDHAARP
jgi:hypothetical protein